MTEPDYASGMPPQAVAYLEALRAEREAESHRNAAYGIGPDATEWRGRLPEADAEVERAGVASLDAWGRCPPEWRAPVMEAHLEERHAEAEMRRFQEKWPGQQPVRIDTAGADAARLAATGQSRPAPSAPASGGPAVSTGRPSAVPAPEREQKGLGR